MRNKNNTPKIFDKRTGKEIDSSKVRPKTSVKNLFIPIQQLEKDLKELRAKYAQFINGIEVKEPYKEKDMLKKNIRKLMLEFNGNIEGSLKLKNLQAALISFERTCMKRVQLKQSKNIARTKKKNSPAYEQQNLSRLFQEYRLFEKEMGNYKSNTKEEQFLKSLEQQKHTLQKKLGCRDVKFSIKKKEGKLVIKAKPLYE